jgi:hypothetical protein
MTPDTKSHSSANFVGIVVGFLNVCIIHLVASSLPPRYLLNATWYDKLVYEFYELTEEVPQRPCQLRWRDSLPYA